MKTLLSLIERSTDSHKKIFKFYSAGVCHAALSKDDIRGQALQSATGLGAFSIRRGEPVILIGNNSPFFARNFFGILYAGGIPVPVAPPDFVERATFKTNLKHIATISQARGVLSEKELAQDLLPPSLTEWKLNDDGFINSESDFSHPNDDDLALLQFSSGSTMAPKGVMLTHRAVLTNIGQIVEAMRVSSETLSSWLPFYHDMGLIGGLLGVLSSNTVAHFSNAIDFLQSPRAWIEHVSRSGTTVIMGPNFLYKNLVKRVPEKFLAGIDLSKLRLALCGAEPVQHKTCERFVEHYKRCGLGEVLFPVYGLAENGLAVTFPDLTHKFQIKRFDGNDIAKGFARETSDGVAMVACGRPLRGIDLRLLDADGGTCGENHIGEIQFRSPSQALGYYNNQPETEKTFVQGWVRTGDMGFIHEGLLYISGRLKDVMILNGKKYFPADVESYCALHTSTGGRMAVFSNFNSREQREELFAVTESKAVWPWSKRRLARQLEEAVWEFTRARPAAVYVTPLCALPRTSSGKVKRYQLRELQRLGKMDSLTHWTGQWKARTAPLKIRLWMLSQIVMRKYRRRESELDRLVATFAEVLEIDKSKVSLNVPFSQFNIDSLKVVMLNDRLRDHGREIPLGDFVRFRKLQDVVDYLGVQA